MKACNSGFAKAGFQHTAGPVIQLEISKQPVDQPVQGLVHWTAQYTGLPAGAPLTLGLLVTKSCTDRLKVTSLDSSAFS